MSDLKNIIIITARQRSGTNALGSILDSHSNFTYCGEVFRSIDESITRPYNYYYYLNKHCNLFDCMPHKLENNFDHYINYLQETINTDYIVLDIKYNQWTTMGRDGGFLVATPPPLISFVQKRNFPIINLERHNYLRSYISMESLKRRKSGYSSSQIQIPINKILHILSLYEQEHKAIQIYFQNYMNIIRIEYADLFPKIN